jgi:hypothetical protein
MYAYRNYDPGAHTNTAGRNTYTDTNNHTNPDANYDAGYYTYAAGSNTHGNADADRNIHSKFLCKYVRMHGRDMPSAAPAMYNRRRCRRSLCEAVRAYRYTYGDSFSNTHGASGDTYTHRNADTGGNFNCMH